MFFMVKLFIGPVSQAPHLVCWSQTLSTTESESEPPMAFTWSSSIRSRMSPMIAKSRSVTFELPPWEAYLP